MTRLHSKFRRSRFLSGIACVAMLQSLVGPLAMAQDAGSSKPASGGAGALESLAAAPLSVAADAPSVTQPLLGANDISPSVAAPNGLANVDPSTGAAHAALPFQLIAARGRIQPSLSLVYDSNSGDREAGLGWGLSLPSIERRSPSGTAPPTYSDPDPGQPIDPVHQDRFVFGGQPLVPICSVDAGGICPEQDGAPMPSFTRRGGWHYYSLLVENGATLRFFWSPDHQTWVVQDKNGNISEYGVPLDGMYDANNGVDVESELPGPIYHAGHMSAVYRWKLVRQYDANRLQGTNSPANSIVYTWNSDGTLSDIYDTPQLTVGPTLAMFAHHAHLNYEPYPYLRATNTPMRSRTPAALLSGVDVTSADMTGTSPRAEVRRYHLSYQTLRHHSLLASFQLEGRCDPPPREDNGLLGATKCPRLPATHLYYEAQAPDYQTAGTDMQGLGTDKPLQNRSVFTLDINGDALPDFLAVARPASGNSSVAPQRLLLNQGQDTLAPQTVDTTPLNNLKPWLDATPTNAVPGATWNALSIELQAAALTPGSRSYAGDFTGDGNVSLFWVNGTPAVPVPCNPPSLEPWRFTMFEYYPPSQVQSSQWRLGLGAQPQQWPPGEYDIDNDKLFGWFGVGDIDGDGYPDRLSSMATYSPGRITPGQCYNNGGKETFVSYAAGVEPTIKGQDGSITPFGYGPIESSASIHYTGPQAGICNTEPPWSYASREWFTQVELGNGPPVNAPFWLIDMDGDGLEDVVIFQNNQFVYYPGHGDGWFGVGVCSPGAGCACAQAQAIGMSASTVGSAVNAAAQAGIPYALHDVTGDGLADVVLLSPDTRAIFVFENLDGAGFGDENVLAIPNSVPDFDASTAQILFADTDGTGADKIVLVTDSAVHYFDLFDGNRPMLLTSIDNGLGASTAMEYSTTAKLFGAGGSARSVNVVTATETKDGAIDTRTEFRYGKPVYDVRDHQFRGFRVVETTVTGDSAVPTARSSVTRYAIGQCAQLPCRGIDQPYEALGPLPTAVFTPGLSLTHTQYSFQQRMHGLDGRNVYLVYPEQVDTYLWPSPTVPSGSLTVTDVDSAVTSVQMTDTIPIPANRDAPHLRVTRGLSGAGNNETWRIDWGRVDVNPDRLIGHATNWQLQGDPGSWIWRPQGKTVSYVNAPSVPGEISPSGPVRDLSYTYDAVGNLLDVYGVLSNTLPLERGHEDPSAKYASGPPPEASTDGFVHLQHRVVDPQGDGNVTLVQSANNECVRYAYDQEYQHLRVQKIVYGGAVGPKGCGLEPLATTFIFDRGFSRATQAVDPNGAMATASYDAFGRMVQERDTDPNSPLPNSLPTFTAEYFVTAGAPIRMHTQRLVGSAMVGGHAIALSPKIPRGTYRERWDFLDGLGRHLATLSSADPSAGDTADWVVSGRTEVSANGFVLKAYQPAFYAGAPASFDPAAPPNPAPYAQSYTYDRFGRPSERFALDGTPAAKIEHSGLKVVLWDADDLDPSSPHQNTPTTEVYDGHGRVIEVDELNEVHSQIVTVVNHWIYEATGEIDSLERTAPGVPTYVHRAAYDTLGRMVGNLEPNSVAWSFNGLSAKGWRYAYNDAGQLVGTSDPRGCGENLYYDAAGRLTGEDYSPCRKSQPEYSPAVFAGGFRSGLETLYSYDSDEPDDTAISAARGRLTAVFDRAAHTRVHYDVRGRVIDTQRQLAVPNAGWVVNASDRYTAHWFDQTIGHDEADEPTSESTGADVPELLDSNGQSTITARYSLRGLLQSVGGSYGSIIASATYDADTLPLTIGYGGGTQTAFYYDTLRRLHEKVVTGSSAPSLLEDSVFAYDRVGNPVEIDDNRNPSDWPDGAKPSSRKSIEYDHAYRLLNIGYWAGSDTFVPANTGLPNAVPDAQTAYRVAAQSFVYDAFGNTIQTNDDADVFFDRSLGNIENGGGSGSSTAGPNALTSASNGVDFLAAHYDGGNLVDLSVQRTTGCTATSGECTHRFVYDWDEVGQMMRARRWDYAGAYSGNLPQYPNLPSMTPAVDMAMSYDADGQRVIKAITTSGGTVDSIQVFPSLRLEGTELNGSEYTRNASIEQIYGVVSDMSFGRLVYDGSDQLPAKHGEKQHMLLEIGDHLGSTAIVVDSVSGDLAERSTYLAYGAPDSDYRPAPWNFWERYRFTGKEADVELGLTYFGARYYSPQLGRFMSPDPVAVHRFGSDPNAYAYVGGRVLSDTDTQGLDSSDGSTIGDPLADVPLITDSVTISGTPDWTALPPVQAPDWGCNPLEPCASDASGATPMDYAPGEEPFPKAHESFLVGVGAAARDAGVDVLAGVHGVGEFWVLATGGDWVQWAHNQDTIESWNRGVPFSPEAAAGYQIANLGGVIGMAAIGDEEGAVAGLGALFDDAAEGEALTLYHGTTASSAARIVANGFRPGADGAVYFAEDYATAAHFAEEAMAARGASGATVIRFTVPAEYAGAFQRALLGAARGAPAIDIIGGTGFEQILSGAEIGTFNGAVQEGFIPAVRLRVGF